MAGIREALEPIQISAMDQRQNTSDIFEAKSSPVKVSRIPDEAYAFALALNYIPIASRSLLHNAATAYCTGCQKYPALEVFRVVRVATTPITFGDIHPRERLTRRRGYSPFLSLFPSRDIERSTFAPAV